MHRHEFVRGEKDHYRDATMRVVTEHWETLKDYLDHTNVSASEVMRILLFRWLRDMKLTKKDSFWNNFEEYDTTRELSLEKRIKRERDFLGKKSRCGGGQREAS